MTDTPILLHVGYHKTATTWMQTRLFMPDHGYRQLMSHEEIHDLIIAPHGLEWDPAPARALIAERRKALLPGEVPVISSEILSGQPFTGARESDVYAERLAQIAPGSKVMISIRAQLKILPSIYMQYLLRGGTLPLREFFFEKPKVGFFRFSPVHFEYHRLVGKYQALFGPQSVFILQQERLRSDAEAAVTELAAFCANSRFAGLSPAAKAAHPPSYPEYAVPVLRRMNHFQKSPMHHWPVVKLGEDTGGAYRLAGYLMRRKPVERLLGNRKPATDFVKEHFRGRFDASNARLAEISSNPLDLRQY